MTRGGTTEERTEPMESPMIAANKGVARAFFTNFEKGDVEAVIALFSPTALYWIPTVRREYGMTEFKQALHWIQSRLRDGIRFKLGPIVAEEKRVCAMAESFAITMEGRPFNNLYHTFFEIDAGKIVYAREYNDTAHVFETLRAQA
jgi:ketosteroid isomerase-like protein